MTRRKSRKLRLCLLAVLSVSGLSACKSPTSSAVKDEIDAAPTATPVDSLRPGVTGTDQAVVVGDFAVPVAEVSDKFLSFAVDTSQILGGKWWSAAGVVEGMTGVNRTNPFNFDRAKLDKIVAALAPAYMRIGGTEADKTYYDLADSPVTTAPAGFDLVLTRAIWDKVNAFATRNQLRELFTLNDGPAVRSWGVWNPASATNLIDYTAAHSYPVDVWELGNEPNAYALAFGVLHTLSGKEVAKNVSLLKTVVKRAMPASKVAGPASAYWPVIGEALRPLLGVLGDFTTAGAGGADIVTWHYYPMQSRRCALAVRRASPSQLLDASHLDEFKTWSKQVTDRVAHDVPGTEVWLGETGNAQCGGEPGVSDVFLGTLWWLDELGLAAKANQQVVIRQNLSGANYSLIDDDTLTPHPDYWASLLWKKLMGTKVLNVSLTGGSNSMRIYAHCTPPKTASKDGSVTVVMINDSIDRVQNFDLSSVANADDMQLFSVATPDVLSQATLLNGLPLDLAPDGTVPRLSGVPSKTGATVNLGPLSYAFAVLPNAGATACTLNSGS